MHMIISHIYLNFESGLVRIERLFIQVYYLRVAGSLVYIEILFLKFYYSHGQCSRNNDDAISTREGLKRF